MLDEKFCTLLEYAISKAMKNVDTEELRGFWCDGVILQNDYSAKLINDKRKVIGTAFIGKTGQDKYELFVNFGRRSLSKFIKGLELNDCVPDDNNSDWLTIDTANKKLIIQFE